MPCRKISYAWLCTCMMLTLTSIPYIHLKAQQAVYHNDTLHPARRQRLPEKITPLKISTDHTDALYSFKDSVYSLVWPAVKQKVNAVRSVSPDSLPVSLNKDSLGNYLLSLPGPDLHNINKDSLIQQLSALPANELKKRFGILKQAAGEQEKANLSRRLTSLLPVSLDKPASTAVIGGGYLNYNYLFRSAVDTPYMERNVGQHLVNAQLDVAVAELPFQLSYYGRKSNSVFLRDYNDFRVAFNVPRYRKMKQDRLREQINKLAGRLQPSGLTQNLKGVKEKIIGIKKYLNNTGLLNRYLKAKQHIAYANRLPDDIGDKDALLEISKNIVNNYEKQQQRLEALEKTRDSLQVIYYGNVRKIQRLQQLVDGNMYTAQGMQHITGQLKEEGVLDRETGRLLKTAYAVRSFAIGRTLPDMSSLTVKNLNVTGVNFEYNAGNLYAALTAGKIDLRSRDFIYGRPSKIPQRVYAAAIGYGTKESNHLIVTGYTGKKQIISNTSAAASALSGMSIRGQWVAGRYFKISGEAAQSTSPVYASLQATQKQQGFKINDKSNKAYAVRAWGYLPATLTRFEGYYQKTGINFQNFTSYRVNANTSTWSMRIEQYLWKKQLRLLAAARKNDFSNPFVIQQYNSNTVFTSFSATFRKRRFPSFTLGYLPSSQYTIVGDHVAESRYQSLNISTAHTYRIGLMKANGTFTYNRFYNSGTDTGFVYYNANHFYTWHQFIFPLFTANLGYARTANKQYGLDVMDGGLVVNYTKYFSMGGGVKINKYNTAEVKTGLYYNFRCRLQRIGDFNLWYERGYLPGSANTLMKNEWFTMGFTRYFNNTIKL